MRLPIKHKQESLLTGFSQTEDKWTGYNWADIVKSKEIEIGVEHWYWQATKQIVFIASLDVRMCCFTSITGS